jgi:hypothetical protein
VELLSSPEERMDTLKLRAYYGTELKVSTVRGVGQTGVKR